MVERSRYYAREPRDLIEYQLNQFEEKPFLSTVCSKVNIVLDNKLMKWNLST